MWIIIIAILAHKDLIKFFITKKTALMALSYFITSIKPISFIKNALILAKLVVLRELLRLITVGHVETVLLLMPRELEIAIQVLPQQLPQQILKQHQQLLQQIIRQHQQHQQLPQQHQQLTQPLAQQIQQQLQHQQLHQQLIKTVFF